MKRTVIVYAAALALSLGVAYRTWTHEGDPDLSKATVILSIDREELTAIEFSSATIDVRMELKTDELGDYIWVDAAPKAEAEAAPAADEPPDPHDPHASPKGDGKAESFKAGTGGEAIATGMAPFVAKRVLEGVDEAKLAELGFGEDQATLTLHREGREPSVFEVGAKAYGGSNRYVRDANSGTVYIVASNLIDTMETAKRSLPDRALQGFDVKDIQQVTVRGGEASATFVQNNPDDRQARFWSSAGASQPNPAAAGWLDKALRLRISRYLAEGERPANLEEVFSFSVRAGRKEVAITVLRNFGDDGAENWFATSAHNRALVQLHRSAASETQADLASVLDAGA